MSEPAALERRCRRLPLVLLTGWTILAAVMPRHSRPVLSSGPDKPGVA
jgi:hypothetical protein